jgi:hypothetical protein
MDPINALSFELSDLVHLAGRLGTARAMEAVCRQLALAAQIQAGAAASAPPAFVPREVRPTMSREEWIATYARGA